jgi:uroporphyrinogen-III synthase
MTSFVPGDTSGQWLGNRFETRTEYTGAMREPDWAPLTGFRVAVTSARRADELTALLQRRGATVTSAAAIAMVPLPDDDQLREHTEALIDVPPDVVIATTGIGFRGWVAAADGWGRTHELLVALGKARVVSRGPKATGALRAAGLPEEWSPESESSRELLHYLVDGGIAGQRIAVQLHGATDDWDPFPEFLDELRAAGADVVPIRVYRWHPAPRNGDFDHLVAGIAEGKFDAVSFTSAPAVASVLMRAAEMGIEDLVLSAFRSGVHAMCVGPVTARPLVRLGVPTSAPERMRLGALARHITDELPLLQSRTVRVAGHLLEIRGTCVLVDGAVKALPPAGMATIRALAQRPGAVVSRSDLLGALPGSGTDTHAVETAVLRLRTALGDKHIVSTVVKRGYRLAVDDELARAL